MSARTDDKEEKLVGVWRVKRNGANAHLLAGSDGHRTEIREEKDRAGVGDLGMS